ncbi:MAG: protein translocase subunit SecF [Clostridiales bacterium]|jgi:preprotein translocase SecF subunit|nr:protein translocase subunit SecF [Clostridiales bacterium]
MFNIIEKKWYFLGFSGIIILAGLISLFAQGLNWDIDFTGGTSLQISLGQQFENSEIEQLVAGVIDGKVSVQKAGNEGTEVIIKTGELDAEKLRGVYTAIAEKYAIEDINSAVISADNFSAIVGKDLRESAIWASIIAALLMLIYISFRFELLSAVSAILALAHDVLVLLAVYSIFQISVNLTFVAALLTILGYSINDTIVIFDRVRENLKTSKKESVADVANKSVWQTMRRSVYTSATTIVTILALYVLGVPSIREFALPLIIGITFGTYSSIFIACPLWIMLSGEDKKKA